MDITNNFFAFQPSNCLYIRVFSPNILSQAILSIKIAVIKIEKDITFWKIIKRNSIKKMTDFLQVPNNLSSRKKNK